MKILSTILSIVAMVVMVILTRAIKSDQGKKYFKKQDPKECEPASGTENDLKEKILINQESIIEEQRMINEKQRQIIEAYEKKIKELETGNRMIP